MFDYDDWKTTQPIDALREKLWDKVMDMSLTEVRRELIDLGVLDSFNQKVRYDIRQRWVDVVYDLRSEK